VPKQFVAPPPLAVSAGLLTEIDPAPLGEDFPVSVQGGMGSSGILVGLEGAAYVPRYGVGATVRVAPPGSRLLAFGVSLTGTGVGPGTAQADATVGLQIDSGPVRELPGLSAADYAPVKYYAAVVSQHARSVVLVFDGAGFRQTLSLPDAAPGRDNIALYDKAISSDYADVISSVDAQVSADGITRTSLVQVHEGNSALEYFTPFGVTPSARDRAFLHLDLCYTADLSSDAASCDGFAATDLVLSVDGRQIRARDIAPGPQEYPVFEVPVTFTDATLTVRGTTAAGVTVTFTPPYVQEIRIG
jgi:hypothetical protein